MLCATATLNSFHPSHVSKPTHIWISFQVLSFVLQAENKASRRKEKSNYFEVDQMASPKR
jgi:hypothetical protein